MPISWGKFNKGSPALLINKIINSRTYSDDGRISYEGSVVSELTPVLISYLKFPRVADHLDKNLLIWKSLTSPVEELNEKNFIQIINSMLSEEMKKKECEYHILSTISLDTKGLFKKIKVLDCELNFSEKDFPKKYIKARNEDISRFKDTVKPTPPYYNKVIAIVRAKSEEMAFHKAMHAIDLLRAIMCLIGNPFMQISFGSRSKEPINVIRFGAAHTLHLKSGEVADKKYSWYEPDFTQRINYQFKNPVKANKKIRWALRRLSSLKFSEKVELSLVRYARAFDEPNYNTAFIKLWGALEYLLTPGQADYDKLIRRCAFLFRDVEYYGVILEHLRVYRNKSIHAGEMSIDSKILCYQLQQFYDAVIWFSLGRGLQFNNLDELGDFLDLPTEKLELERSFLRAKEAVKFRRPK